MKIQDTEETGNTSYTGVEITQETSQVFLPVSCAKTWKIDGAKLLWRRRSPSKKLDSTYMEFVKFADTKIPSRSDFKVSSDTR